MHCTYAALLFTPPAQSSGRIRDRPSLTTPLLRTLPRPFLRASPRRATGTGNDSSESSDSRRLDHSTMHSVATSYYGSEPLTLTVSTVLRIKLPTRGLCGWSMGSLRAYLGLWNGVTYTSVLDSDCRRWMRICATLCSHPPYPEHNSRTRMRNYYFRYVELRQVSLVCCARCMCFLWVCWVFRRICLTSVLCICI